MKGLETALSTRQAACAWRRVFTSAPGVGAAATAAGGCTASFLALPGVGSISANRYAPEAVAG